MKERKMKKFHIFALVVTSLVFIIPETGHSIPAFVRKHGFNCNMCHTAFTKLNDLGQRFRDNGYQLPDQEGFEKNVFETAPPLALRTTSGLSIYDDTTKGNTSGLNIFGLDLLAAGVLHRNISFMFIYTPRIDEPAADYTGSDNGRNPAQLAALESANIVFSNIIKDKLNLRIGRFEPAYQAFSSKRSFYIFEPYEIYVFQTASNSFAFGDNQIGIEATGHFRNGSKYGLGVVNGNGANPDNNKYKDLYLNLFQILGRGDGQSAGQRVGAFGYLGWQPAVLPGSIVSPTGETDGKDNKSFYRIGGDMSFNWMTFNLQALFMQGTDDKALNTLDSTRDYTYSGGFAQLDWAGLLSNRLVASVLFNWVQPPSYDDSNTIKAYSALLRYYLGDWTAVNVAFHAEYTHKRTGKTNPCKENLLTLLVDFDF
jgi:hypothetical protein